MRGKLGARTRVLVLAVELIMGLGALFGGYNLLHDAEGFGLEEAWLEGSPFGDYTVPGLFLLGVIGGGMLASAALSWRSSRFAAAAALIMGVILLAWLLIETAIVGFQGSQQAWLLLVCGASGLILLGAGFRALRPAAGA